jgi:hypothetical protein
MKWLTNSAGEKFVVRRFEQSIEEAISDYRRFLSDKIIGDPKATDFYTVEELKAMEVFGVYSRD